MLFLACSAVFILAPGSALGTFSGWASIGITPLARLQHKEGVASTVARQCPDYAGHSLFLPFSGQQHFQVHNHHHCNKPKVTVMFWPWELYTASSYMQMSHKSLVGSPDLEGMVWSKQTKLTVRICPPLFAEPPARKLLKAFWKSELISVCLFKVKPWNKKSLDISVMASHKQNLSWHICHVGGKKKGSSWVV